MNILQQLLDRLKLRLAKKLAKAQKAYVQEHTCKVTENCFHRGRALSDRIRVCKLGCIGDNETSAGQCWNEKASWCPEFQLRKSAETVQAEFQGMSEAEIRLRWPSIGEILWMKRETEQLLQIGMERINGTETKAC